MTCLMTTTSWTSYATPDFAKMSISHLRTVKGTGIVRKMGSVVEIKGVYNSAPSKDHCVD